MDNGAQKPVAPGSYDDDDEDDDMPLVIKRQPPKPAAPKKPVSAPLPRKPSTDAAPSKPSSDAPPMKPSSDPLPGKPSSDAAPKKPSSDPSSKKPPSDTPPKKPSDAPPSSTAPPKKPPSSDSADRKPSAPSEKDKEKSAPSLSKPKPEPPSPAKFPRDDSPDRKPSSSAAPPKSSSQDKKPAPGGDKKPSSSSAPSDKKHHESSRDGKPLDKKPPPPGEKRLGGPPPTKGAGAPSGGKDREGGSSGAVLKKPKAEAGGGDSKRSEGGAAVKKPGSGAAAGGGGGEKKRPVPEKGGASASAPPKKVKVEQPAAKPVKPPPDESDSEDDKPLSARLKSPVKAPPKRKRESLDRKSKDKGKKGAKAKGKAKGSGKASGGDSQKWTSLIHNGVIFPPNYVPHGVKMLYDGKPVDLTPDQEEVATMFAVMKDTDYMKKQVFLQNFWRDWQKVLGKKHVIQRLDKCDFTPIYDFAQVEKERKKSLSTEEKKKLKEEKDKAEEKYMWAMVDGVKEKVGNFRVEPPGLFRGRGEHPKMGRLKKRIVPEDVAINISKDAPVPVCPVPGHKWGEVRHDNTVTWLAYWKDPISTSDLKYVFLAASSALKGQSDREKYEKARKLKDHIENIRDAYTRSFLSKDATKRQLAVATYLIDRLALRAGNEKGDDEADTVGCCSLKVENVQQVPPNKIEFDFLGKDSIRYYNTVEVEKLVYDAVGDFMKGKKKTDDLFEEIDTNKLNMHLKEIMPGLTAKVFRTYNASITLDRLLQDTEGSIVPEKTAEYARANKEVAILCNHQKSVSKNHDQSMAKMQEKFNIIEAELKELQEDLDRAKKNKPPLKRGDGTPKKALSVQSLEKKVRDKKLMLQKHELQMRNREDLKTVALGTSKINYMDPRISIAWCKLHDVPIEKIFNKSLLAKFAWALDVEPEYRF